MAGGGRVGEPRVAGDAGRAHGQSDHRRPRASRRCRAIGRLPPVADGPARPGMAEDQAPSHDDDRATLFVLLEAESEPLRPEILAWLHSTLAAEPKFQMEWVLRVPGQPARQRAGRGDALFRGDSRASEDVSSGSALLESPHDDIRLPLAADLECQLARGDGKLDLSTVLDPDRLRLLWASVLLNVRRGGRVKPRVVEQVAHRLGHRPEEAEPRYPSLPWGCARSGPRAPRGPRGRGAAGRESARDNPARPTFVSRVAMGLSLCDHDRASDPEGGRAVPRDHHAAAIRRGRT